jgi:hypothetical protein
MEDLTPTRANAQDSALQHDVGWKQWLDDWLDNALVDTFPASDPVASPPADATFFERAVASPEYIGD